MKVKRNSLSLLFGLVLGLSAYGFVIEAPSFADSVSLDQSEVSKGIIKVSVKLSGDTKIKMIIQKDDKKYVYDLPGNGEVSNFPLQMGNGDYTVGVYKNITESKYAPISSETVKLNVKDQKVIFLQSVQNIRWTASSEAVKKADALVKAYKEDKVKLQTVYDYVVANYKYDYDKAENVKSGYIPDIDETYSTKKGICYDYSALFAAMLRSNDIPARLVKGYTTNVEGYHAWNEVYEDHSDSWLVIDTTYDAQMKTYKRSYTLKKRSSDYQNVYIY